MEICKQYIVIHFASIAASLMFSAMQLRKTILAVTSQQKTMEDIGNLLVKWIKLPHWIINTFKLRLQVYHHQIKELLAKVSLLDYGQENHKCRQINTQRRMCMQKNERNQQTKTYIKHVSKAIYLSAVHQKYSISFSGALEIHSVDPNTRGQPNASC